MVALLLLGDGWILFYGNKDIKIHIAKSDSVLLFGYFARKIGLYSSFRQVSQKVSPDINMIRQKANRKGHPSGPLATESVLVVPFCKVMKVYTSLPYQLGQAISERQTYELSH